MRKCIDCDIGIDKRHWSSTRCESCQNTARKKQHKKYFKKYYYDGPGQEDAKIWRQENKDKTLQYRKKRQKYRADNRKAERDYNRQYYKENKNRFTEKRRENTEELSDYYIKKLLSCKKNNVPFKFKDIPDALVNVKRKQMKLYRTINNSQVGEGK